ASAPLFSVRPDRLLVQIPPDLPVGQAASLTVSTVNLSAPPIPLRLESAVPAIVAATRTADALVIYATGLGATDPSLREGLAAPTTMLLRTTVQPSVWTAGQPATVFFSGLVPGMVGLYQINVLLPVGLS